MRYILTVNRDTVAEDCQRQINMYENVAVAKRAWGNGINYILRNGNPDNIPVEDLQLWKIGEFDTETMAITPCKEFIAAGAEFAIKFAQVQLATPVAPVTTEVTEDKGE